MTHGSLFSGIGGFDLAAEWMGWENKFHCEWNEFGQKVLNYYWPEAECFTDITKTDFTKYANRIDVLTGGFPCQPYSTSGKRLGKEDERHLWPEMLRAIREIQPGWIVGENVRGLVSWSGGLVFHEVQTDLEAQGYEVFPVLLPAAGVNAPHERYRIWFIAHSSSNVHKRELVNGGYRETTIRSEREDEQSQRWNEVRKWLRVEPGTSSTTDSECWINAHASGIGSAKVYNEPSRDREKVQGIQDARQTDNVKSPVSSDYWANWPTVAPICHGDDGISSRLDTNAISFAKWRNESIKAGGNAIVPQVALQIFKTIEQYMNRQVNSATQGTMPKAQNDH